MKRLVLALSSLTLIACGGGASTQVKKSESGSAASGFEVKAPSGGSIVDRLLVMQESFFALIASSQTSDEAAAKIDAYCTEHQQAVHATLAEQQAHMDNEDMAVEFQQRSEGLMKRAEELYSNMPNIMEDGKVIEAMDRCKPQG
jgi:hypothetical protein